MGPKLIRILSDLKLPVILTARIGVVVWLSFFVAQVKAQPRSETLNQTLSIQWLADDEFQFWRFTADGTHELIRVNATTGKLETVQSKNGSGGNTLLPGNPPRSIASADHSGIRFINRSKVDVQLFWVDQSGRLQSYGNLAPNEERDQHTFAGHCWAVLGPNQTYFGSVVGAGNRVTAVIEKEFDLPERLRETLNGPRRRRRDVRRRSEEGKRIWEHRLRDNTLAIRRIDDQAAEWISLEIDLDRDAGDQEIQDPRWSPDGRVLACWKVTRHPAAEVYTIKSSTENGPRGVLQSQPYRLPGDAMDEYELLCFDAESGKRLSTELPTIDFRSPRIRWRGDHELLIEKVDRGHQRFRLFAIDPVAGSRRTVIDESTKTFIWTTHGPRVPLVTYLSETDEVIYSSERSGYRHLYLVDLAKESSMRPITVGDWLVREIVHLDERKRTIDLMAGELIEGQDPYHRHLVRVGFDGDLFTVLTDGDGDHEIEFSPKRDWIVATHSRADQPPVHELRRVSDGAKIVELAKAVRVGDSLPRLPVRFHAKGRDGEHDIWGLIHFPNHFDGASKARYPIIEAIYAGPHDSHVPKRYRNGKPFEELTSLGFVVVQIDGMGTANRSKKFHDVCWHNLKDAGFPDRIAWIKAAAAVYPAMDTSRVGIFGTSAGGQNACGALLFHGDFYRAAMASCGCHDNRMDKSSWNEQWMGFPVAAHYSECSNIDQAHRLKGDLLLIVGELDTNVPPASTFRLVDALIKADKDFEFLMVPGMGHSDGGVYGRRKMRSFFVDKLRPQAAK